MQGIKQRIKAWWEQRPLFDLVVGTVVAPLCWLLDVQVGYQTLTVLLPALSALAALVFTAGTFAASQATQSTAPVTVMLREANAAQLHRTWCVILGACLFTAAAALALLAVPGKYASAVSATAFGLLAMTALCGGRAVVFSLAVLAADQMRDPRPVPVPGPADD